MFRRTFLCLSISLASLVFLESSSFGQKEWAQWRGPHRDGYAAPQSLLKAWPNEGPKLAWSFEKAGTGFSSISVSKNLAVTLGKRGEDNFLVCLDISNGKELWVTKIGTGAVRNSYLTDWGDGPRSSPTIDGDFIYALCDLGNLGCYKLNGEKVWSVNLVKDFGGSIPKWGYSESVLVDGDRIMVTPGGANFIVGLDKSTGKKVWESKYSAGAHYVSIIKHTFEGIDTYLSASDQGLVCLDCKTGEPLFKNEATKNSVAVIPTPIVSGNIVYHTAAYGSGNVAVKVSLVNGKLQAEQLYHFTKESMSNHHGGNILFEKTIYGFSKDLRGVWMAQDFESGEVLWSKKVGKATSGSIAMADGLLYCYDDQDGICYLVEPSRSGWKQLGKVTLPKTTSIDRKQGAIWAHPVIANQKLIIRDHEMIFAFDISGK
jgi:outer membrane protein assembly factor BamB